MGSWIRSTRTAWPLGILATAVCPLLGCSGGSALPIDRFAGSSGECIGVDDTRDLPETGWLRRGQADFSFEVADDARSLSVTTVDDPLGNNDSQTITWNLDDAGEGLVLSTDDMNQYGDVVSVDIPIEWQLEGGDLVVEADFSEMYGELKVFEVDVEQMESGVFEIAAEQGGMMRCRVNT